MARKFKRHTKLVESHHDHKLKKRQNYRASRKSRKRQALLNKAKSFVTNLSPCKLTANQICLIAKGQKFVPLHKLNKADLMQDIHELGRKMRIKCLFLDTESEPLHPFWEKAVNFTPPMANNSVENFIHALLVECSCLKPEYASSNLTGGEKSAITELTTNSEIILRPADKGSNTVVLSKKQYDDECRRLLTGSIHYEEIPMPHPKETHDRGLMIISRLNKNGHLDKQTYNYLYRPNFKPRVAKFYILPKIHKIKEHLTETDPMLPDMDQNVRIPGRPIIAQCGAATERIGRYLDYFLVPIVQKDPFYLLDSKELVYLLEHTEFPANVLLITYDVTSMYTNMPHDELLASTKRALETNLNMDFGLRLPPVSDYMDLLRILITETEFSYNGRYYRQVVGASMGAIPSPEICDIRMLELLREILPRFRHHDKILLNKKYRDDGLILFHGTEKEARELFEIANSAHPLLKFEFQISDSQCTFLDLDIYKGPRFLDVGKFDTKTHTKATECFAYLLRSSAHPPACFRGFIKGELGRYRRNASNEHCYLKKAQSFKSKLLERNYKESEVDKCFNDMKFSDRRLNPRQYGLKRRGTLAPPLVLATKFHPKLWALNRIMKKYWPMVLRNHENKKIFPRPPMLAYRRGQNLSELLNMRK